MSTQLESDLLAQVMGRSEAKIGSQQPQVDAATISHEQFADCLFRAAKSVLTTMCDMEVGVAGELHSGITTQRHSLSGIVGMSGAVKATIVINLPPVLAMKASGALLGSVSKEIDGDVIDTIAELANMIGGNTKNLLGIKGGQLSIPTVVKGPDHSLVLSSKTEQWGMDIDVDGSQLRLEFILCDD